jgi:hypothetical protein
MQSIQEFPEFVRKLPKIALPFRGARGWLMQAVGRQTVFIEFDKRTAMPEHVHAEQWEFPLAGSVVVRSRWGEMEYLAGDNFYLPADEPHSATVSDGYKAMIIFNCADRYRPKK